MCLYTCACLLLYLFVAWSVQRLDRRLRLVGLARRLRLCRLGQLVAGREVDLCGWECGMGGGGIGMRVASRARCRPRRCRCRVCGRCPVWVTTSVYSSVSCTRRCLTGRLRSEVAHLSSTDPPGRREYLLSGRRTPTRPSRTSSRRVPVRVGSRTACAGRRRRSRR